VRSRCLRERGRRSGCKEHRLGKISTPHQTPRLSSYKRRVINGPAESGSGSLHGVGAISRMALLLARSPPSCRRARGRARTSPNGRAIVRVLDRRSTRRPIEHAAGTNGWPRWGRTKGLGEGQKVAFSRPGQPLNVTRKLGALSGEWGVECISIMRKAAPYATRASGHWLLHKAEVVFGPSVTPLQTSTGSQRVREIKSAPPSSGHPAGPP
jgi:hypothetical protein